MQLFARNKLVTIHQKDQNTLWVRGVLEDDIYGLSIDIDVCLPELTILSASVTWNRYTTPECPRAAEHIADVEGLRIDADIVHKLQKGVGRSGCRHFATLLIECCKSVQETAALIAWQRASQSDPDLCLSDVLEHPDRFFSAAAEQSSQEPRLSDAQKAETPRVEAPPSPGPPPVAAKKDGGFLIDLHIHTYPASPCANESVDQMIQAAQRIGLDGICLTDHNYRWSAEEVQALRSKYDFLVLRGNEVTTDQGHMVVFGMDQDIPTDGILKLETLHEMVKQANGFIIAAHPFRGFLTFGVGKLGLTVEKAAQRPLFQLVDAVEVLNGMVTEEENRFAAQVCEHLGLAGTGGSDAHHSDRVGCYVTRFETPISSENELLEALRKGRCRPMAFNLTKAEN